MFLLSLRTHESMEIQFSMDGIHQKWPYCLPTWGQKVISGPFSLGLGLKTETYKNSVSDSVSILRLRKENVSLALGLETETWKNWYSDSVSKLSLRKFESRSWNWDSESFSLGLGLKIETQKIWVSDSVSKLRLRKFESRTRSGNWDSENSSLWLDLEIQKLVSLIPEKVLKRNSHGWVGVAGSSGNKAISAFN